jgi:hypothetical protein
MLEIAVAFMPFAAFLNLIQRNISPRLIQVYLEVIPQCQVEPGRQFVIISTHARQGCSTIRNSKSNDA